ncbi:STE24 [Candida jiufengensis]|uniref:STE24 n=1 Tax=Candida jiufengensis TaxID=497108 RepID=UPI002224DABB|nr:STE24 [Candida jiufengensis]KAI5950271.1 STE24 [Candida jiufengensis]
MFKVSFEKKKRFQLQTFLNYSVTNINNTLFSWKPLISSFVVFKGIFELCLQKRQFQKISKNHEVTTNIHGFDQLKIEKGIQYSLLKLKFNGFKIIYESIIDLIFVKFNLYYKIWSVCAWLSKQNNVVVENQTIYLSQTILFITLSSFLILLFKKLPMNYIENFQIEKKLGFFKSGILKWIMFEFLMTLLQLFIDILGIIVCLKSFQFFNFKIEIFKLSIITILFGCFILFIYPILSSFITKQNELPEGELRIKIETFTEKQTFKLKKIYVAEVSSTTSHSNASVEGNPLSVKKISIPIDLIFKILKNYLQQNFEYQADSFATTCGYKESMKNALIRLTDQNLSNTSDDWLYSSLYSTHPSKIDRLNAIDKN